MAAATPTSSMKALQQANFADFAGNKANANCPEGVSTERSGGVLGNDLVNSQLVAGESAKREYFVECQIIV
ncbi:hypothetical protein KEM54_001395 [Ascosphaera aggregata]|nr:hypothetical protein KEM54_001395 [Ascosphaera aggregata]